FRYDRSWISRGNPRNYVQLGPGGLRCRKGRSHCTADCCEVRGHPMGRGRARRYGKRGGRVWLVWTVKRSREIDYLPCVDRRILYGIGTVVLTLAGCKSPQTTTADSTAPPAASAPASAAPSAPAIVIPEKTVLEARIDQTLSTENNRAGDRFVAS